MHSYEDRIRAVELYYRYGKKASVVVMELGYPSTKQLGRWVRIYEEKGDLPRELKPRERYSRTQKIAAVEHYLTHGGCLSYTRRAIGYPSNEILKRWIEEFYPNARPLVIRSGTNKCFSPEERSQAVRELCNRRGTARKVAQSIGVSVPVLYKWKKDLISDEAYQSMRKQKAAPQDKNQDARRIMLRVKASSGVSKTKCSMAETGRVSRWKNLSASWTGTYAGITRNVSSYH